MEDSLSILFKDGRLFRVFYLKIEDSLVEYSVERWDSLSILFNDGRLFRIFYSKSRLFQECYSTRRAFDSKSRRYKECSVSRVFYKSLL